MGCVCSLPGKGNREDNILGTCQKSHRRAGIYQIKRIVRVVKLHMSDLERQYTSYLESRLLYDTKVGLVCLFSNHILRHDRACETSPSNKHPYWYGNMDGMEEGGS